MRILLLSFGLGQYYCNYPIEEEFINRGHHTDSICVSAFQLFKECNEMNIESYDVVIANDLKFVDDIKRLKIKSKLLVGCIHTLAPKDENWLRNMMRANVDLSIEPGKYVLKTLGNDLDKYKDRIFLGGFPKTDYLIRNKDKKKEIRNILLNRFNFNKDYPIILYAPTYSTGWHAGGTFIYCEKIYNILKKEKLNLIIGPHPGDQPLLHKMTGLENCDNIRICLDFNKNDLILGSDLVISDNSSIVLEASLAEVPIMQLFKEEGLEATHLYSNPEQREFIIGDAVIIPKGFNILAKHIWTSMKNNPKEVELNYWLSELCSDVTGNDAKRYVDEIERRLFFKYLKAQGDK